MLAVLPSGPLLPPWIVVPVAAATMLVIAVHLVSLWQADIPPSRRRIRTINAVLMLITTPLAAYAACALSPAQARPFVLIWTLVAGLLAIIFFVAVLDAANTFRIARRESADLRREARELRERLLDAQASADKDASA